MGESLASRVGRIISGGFNAIVDAIEDTAPETVMEQAIREVDDAIAHVRAELGKQIANKHLASKYIARENTKHEQLSAKIELALAEGREDLAEVAVSSQLDIEAKIPVLEQSLADCSAKEKRLEEYILALRAKKREMRQELTDYRSMRQNSSAQTTPEDSPGGSDNGTSARASRAISTFERVLARQTGLRSVSGASDSENAAKLAELEDISRENRVKERLLAAKGELKKKGLKER